MRPTRGWRRTAGSIRPERVAIVATAELLEFCAEHGITADVEVLPSSRVGEALERLGRGDVRYRFVLDLPDLEDLDLEDLGPGDLGPGD
ncbi:hypothetical protein GCM10009821_28980 [Aeromicrobium halocynthiae]|uniref:Uncharacterized protein n=1 Tax=Aeromicrobium halocynthiae TaxID=560557 RepID=A0ABN2W786_9ACTN